MEVRGEWCGLFFSLKFSYSTTMSQQFCRRLWVFAKIYRTATQEKMRDFSQSNFVIQYDPATKNLDFSKLAETFSYINGSTRLGYLGSYFLKKKCSIAKSKNK